jgi:4-carboxymuconolactone decarboxylase
MMCRSLGLFALLASVAGAPFALAAPGDNVEYLDSGKILPRGLPFSEAVRVGNTLYLSGQIGIAPGTLKVVPGGIKEEAHQAMENIKATLEAHGYTMADLVKCTAMLADMAEWGTFNEVYRTFFQAHFPARSAFGANGLALGARVEVECIAAGAPVKGAEASQKGGQARFPPIAREQMNEAQQRVFDAIAGGPRGGVRGPFGPLLRSPELADRVQKLGEYLRFNTSLPPRLSEMAILINARIWGSKYEWFAHTPFALKGGLAKSIVEDILRERRPTKMAPDEELVYDLCATLHRTHFVDDALYARAVAAFGERGVVDLVSVSGYYTLVSMVLNVAEIPLPDGAPSPW